MRRPLLEPATRARRFRRTGSRQYELRQTDQPVGFSLYPVYLRAEALVTEQPGEAITEYQDFLTKYSDARQWHTRSCPDFRPARSRWAHDRWSSPSPAHPDRLPRFLAVQPQMG